jgi:hypothetical protein
MMCSGKGGRLNKDAIYIYIDYDALSTIRLMHT